MLSFSEIDWGNAAVSSTNSRILIPEIKPIQLGEYGRELEKIWNAFINVRRDGFYAADYNHSIPRFTENFALHGVAGLDKRDKPFQALRPDLINRLTKIGVITSDIEFIDHETKQSSEEETFGSADFWVADEPYDGVLNLLAGLRRKVSVGHEFITSLDSTSVDSATLLFAFDMSRPGIASLARNAMKDTDQELWTNRFGKHITNFPVPGLGIHLAVPVGLPANYIEYILLNEKSQYWQADQLTLLRKLAVCDNHQIPLVSVVSGEVIFS